MGSHALGGLGEAVGSLPRLRELQLYLPFNNLQSDIRGLLDHIPRLAASLAVAGPSLPLHKAPCVFNLDMANNHALDQTACEQVAAVVQRLPQLKAIWVNFPACSGSLSGVPHHMVMGTPCDRIGAH